MKFSKGVIKQKLKKKNFLGFKIFDKLVYDVENNKFRSWGVYRLIEFIFEIFAKFNTFLGINSQKSRCL